MADPPPAAADPTSDYTAFQSSLFTNVMATVQATGALAASDIAFQRTSSPGFARALDSTNKRILGLVNALLATAAASSGAAVRLADEDDVETRWPAIVEVADALLEKADTCLDEYTGAIKKQLPAAGGAGAVADRFAGRASRGKNFTARSWASRNMAKPQLLFEVLPDNNAAGPWRPVISVKPHAVVPLAESVVLETNSLTGREGYAHPYRREIEEMTYPAAMFEVREPVMYTEWETTEPVFVDEPAALLTMLAELKQATEIAVDLEHHDARSYVGFVCLMQISTREKDWIVDTLKLRGELQILNEVFADPKIIKVLHGAYMDVVWLQRDFGLYVVGLFDTYFAARALGLAGHGLAFLLKKYVDFDADKQYQLADWRLRPLPEEMLKYARSDTHFLLYIYDNMRNALLEKSAPHVSADNDKMSYVLSNSKETALRLYEREPYDAETGEGTLGWSNMLGRSGEHLDPAQSAVFKAAHAWRDATARAEDEGHHYVLPRHQLFNLARKMPDSVDGVLGCCHPASPPLRARAGELVVAIRNAKNDPAVLEWRAQQAAASAPAAPADTKPQTDLFTDAAAADLRAEASGFWGAAAGSSNWTADADAECTAPRPSLAVPLPALTAEVFVSADAPATPVAKVDPGARAAHEYVKTRPPKPADDAVMVIRSAGGGRKRKLENDAPKQEPGPEMGMGLGLEELEHTEFVDAEPAAKKKKRKRKGKKATAEAEGAEDGEEGEEGDGEVKKEFTPFDYANAPSVLNSKPPKPEKRERKDKKDKKDKEKVKKEKEREYRPYEQEPGSELKGIRISQGQREKSGRSKTFK
ncbi:ribonuclease H-like domain-containing protein [Geopyxis carbonaria]|nr:ribonuclease H-like domain-containing protein [Geopyxis carbonaria]